MRRHKPGRARPTAKFNNLQRCCRPLAARSRAVDPDAAATVARVQPSICQGMSMTAPWGRVDGTPRNFAYLQRSLCITLTIYPPGVTPHERRLLNVRKFATTWAGFVSFLAIVTVAGRLLGITVAVASAAGWALLGVAVALAKRSRPQGHTPCSNPSSTRRDRRPGRQAGRHRRATRFSRRS